MCYYNRLNSFMDILDWNEYLKIDEGYPATTNMVYVPLSNPDGNLLCMDFGNERIKFDNDFFFEREVYFLKRFKKYKWAPEVLEVDYSNKRIFIKWYQETCNNIIFSDRTLEEYCIDWKQQLLNIVRDIESQQVLKLNLYPHCFFIDDKQTMRAMDFYASVDKNNTVYPTQLIENLISKKSKHRWDQVILNDQIDFEKFYFNAINEHIIDWPGHPLKELI